MNYKQLLTYAEITSQGSQWVNIMGENLFFCIEDVEGYEWLKAEGISPTQVNVNKENMLHGLLKSTMDFSEEKIALIDKVMTEYPTMILEEENNGYTPLDYITNPNNYEKIIDLKSFQEIVSNNKGIFEKWLSLRENHFEFFGGNDKIYSSISTLILKS